MLNQQDSSFHAGELWAKCEAGFVGGDCLPGRLPLRSRPAA